MKKFLLYLFLSCMNVHADTVIFSNNSVSMNTISREDVKSLYLMKLRRLEDGQAIILYQLPTASGIHKNFIREVLGITVEYYNREIDRAVNSGLRSNIRIVNTNQEMIKMVAQTQNAIGYIDADHLLIYTGGTDVKVLQIIN